MEPVRAEMYFEHCFRNTSTRVTGRHVEHLSNDSNHGRDNVVIAIIRPDANQGFQLPNRFSWLVNRRPKRLD